MTDALFEAMRVYLDVGYTDIKGFWHLTLSEITELIDSANRRFKREHEKREADIKQQAIMDRNLALQIGEVVACIFSKNKSDITPLYEFYPDLFEAEKKRATEMDLETYTYLWEDYAYRVNQERKRMRGGDANAVNGHDTEEIASSADRQHDAITDGDGASTVSDE